MLYIHAVKATALNIICIRLLFFMTIMNAYALIITERRSRELRNNAQVEPVCERISECLEARGLVEPITF